jgi:hypothetical protein
MRNACGNARTKSGKKPVNRTVLLTNLQRRHPNKHGEGKAFKSTLSAADAAGLWAKPIFDDLTSRATSDPYRLLIKSLYAILVPAPPLAPLAGPIEVAAATMTGDGAEG